MTGLLHAHSGLRYLVLVVGICALLWALYGVLAKRPYDRGMKITASAFVGLLHLQILLGIILIVMGRFYPQLIGHIVLMLAAAGAAQAPVSMMRRRAPEARTYMPHLAATTAALGLIWLAVIAIGRGLFENTVF